MATPCCSYRWQITREHLPVRQLYYSISATLWAGRKKAQGQWWSRSVAWGSPWKKTHCEHLVFFWWYANWYEMNLSENPEWITNVSLDLTYLSYLCVSNKGTIVTSKEILFTHQLTQCVFWRPDLVVVGVGLIDIHWFKLILNFHLQLLSHTKAALESEMFTYW